jgi:WD40 repeat protein
MQNMHEPTHCTHALPRASSTRASRQHAYSKPGKWRGMVLQAATCEELEPVASCQLHRSWISDAQLLQPFRTASPQAEGAALPWLMTACNDGSLSLWDAGSCDADGAFSQLASSRSTHGKGIFSMHVCPVDAEGARCTADTLTSSKDCSVALSSVRGGGMEVVQRWAGLHEGVAKAVRWRSGFVAASAGNDRCALSAQCQHACGAHVVLCGL